MSALLDSLAAGLDASATDDARAALGAALAQGLPGPRSERWRYTSLRALERRSFAPVAATDGPAAFDVSVLADIPSPRVVFVNGVLAAESSDAALIDTGMQVRAGHRIADASEHASEDVFAGLNRALATVGVEIEVVADAHVDAPIHLVFVGAPDSGDHAWHLRHRIALARGASATIVEHHINTGVHRHLANTVLQVDIAGDASLVHIRVQDDAAGATQIASTGVAMHDRARYVRLDLELGSALSRHELDVDLRGDQAHAICNGVLLGTDARHLDTRVQVRHRGRDGACNLNWRGLAGGRSRAAFHGGITIEAGADGTRAALSNKNLLLSDTAEIDTQPVLVIHADEVQAAHGATVGQLDADALFYLRSRGLPLATARGLLTNAFCRETLSIIERADLHALLDARLAVALDRAGT